MICDVEDQASRHERGDRSGVRVAGQPGAPSSGPGRSRPGLLDACTEIGTLPEVGSGSSLACRFYRSSSGREPVRDWLKALGKELSKAIGTDIRRVQMEWPISKPLVDGLGRGLYEVRTHSSRQQYRVLFCIVDSTMVLLHGFIKKARTAPSEIEIGRSRQREAEKG